MKVKIVVPINSSAYNDAVLQAAKQASSNQTYLSIENISQGNVCIESPEDSRTNASYTADLIQKAEREGYDAVFVCDMDMCGIELAKERGVQILMHGGFSSNMPVAAARGNFIVISVLDTVIEMQKKFADLYGNNQCIGIYTTGLGVHDLHGHETTLDTICKKAYQAMEKHAKNVVKSIVFGCSGFVDFAEPLTKALKKKGYKDVLVLDPNRTAIKVIEKQLS